MAEILERLRFLDTKTYFQPMDLAQGSFYTF